MPSSFFALLSSYFLYSYPSQHLSLLGSFPFNTEIPSISMENTPPLFLLHLRGQLTPFSFQLASPPRIHMDSWWAARNPNQGLKWAHNIAQNRSGAYGPEPCRIWVPKLSKSVFYTNWLNEPAEPDANRSNRLQKNFKIWQNIPGRVRNPWKKNGAQFRVRKREIWSK